MPISNYVPTSAIAKPGVCTSSTRPASPYEGQVIYTTDLDTLEIWNGTAWRILAFSTPAEGTILQIKNGTTTTQTTSASSTYVTSNLAATITPTSTTSKVLAQVSISLYNDTAGGEIGLRLVRTIGGTTTTLLTNAQAKTGASDVIYVPFMHLDSPASTSAITYTMHFARAGGTGTVYTQVNSATSSITVMEIAG